MKNNCLIILFLSSIIVIGCTIKAEQSSDQLVSEAREFMENYANDLRAKDGAAVAALYDRTGAYFLGSGQKIFFPFDSIRAVYEERWPGLDSFKWQDLSYEPVGSNSIMVLGKFLWGNENREEPATYSYSGLLLRQDGEMRIRVEDESFDPMTMKDIICQPDSTAE